MEQYLICLLNNFLSDKDQAAIKKYLSCLFPTSFQTQYAKEYSESIATLLKPNALYIAVVNTYEGNQNILWKLLDEDENILNIIENGITKTDSAFGFDSQHATDYISSSIHSLADQLPTFGTYRLDILVGSDVIRELTVSKEPSLAGAFIRLTRWHSAHFTIFEQKEFDSSRLNEWCEIINSQILLQNSKLDWGPSLWRGSVQFRSSNNKNENFKGFQLRMNLDDHHHNCFSTVKDIAKHQISENVILSSKLQVIDEVSFTSIPPYLISPLTFRLCFNRQNILNENSSNIIEYLHKKEKSAFIAKLGYAEVKEKSKADRKYCLNRWQKVAYLGEIKDSECFVSSFEKGITFAITKSNCPDYAIAYTLRDPTSLDASFYFRIVSHRVQNEDYKVTEEEPDIDVPVINESVYQNILHQYSKQVANSNNGLNNNMFKVDSSSTFKSIKILSSFEYDKAQSANLCVEEIDPFDWPERTQLLHKQMENEEECHSINIPVVQNLKIPQQSFSLTSKSIAEHFLPSGEHKNSENLEEIYSTNHTDYLVTCSLTDVLQSEWPKIINFFYHDLYYNSNNKIEDKECLGSQLTNLYIQHETATTCNNQQLTQSFHILVSEKISSPSKAFRGPSSRIANASPNENRHIKDIQSPRAKTLRELISRKILSTSTMNTKKLNEVRKASNEKSKRSSSNKSLVPVRCSPRKQSPVDYRYPSVNRNNTSKKNFESNKIPDLLKKKLRYAVAKALEENGINSTHPMYQPCGSKLLNICRTFLDDLKLKKGKTSEYLQKIADAHVKQVIEFYKD